MYTDDLNMRCAFHRLRFAHENAVTVIRRRKSECGADMHQKKNCGATALPHESFCSCHVPPHLMHAAGAHRRISCMQLELTAACWKCSFSVPQHMKMRRQFSAAEKSAAAALRCTPQSRLIVQPYFRIHRRSRSEL
jgi:hypothetical protein